MLAQNLRQHSKVNLLFAVEHFFGAFSPWVSHHCQMNICHVLFWFLNWLYRKLMVPLSELFRLLILDAASKDGRDHLCEVQRPCVNSGCGRRIYAPARCARAQWLAAGWARSSPTNYKIFDPPPPYIALRAIANGCVPLLYSSAGRKSSVCARIYQFFSKIAAMRRKSRAQRARKKACSNKSKDSKSGMGCII